MSPVWVKAVRGLGAHIRHFMRWLVMDENSAPEKSDKYFDMTMLGLSLFYRRLDPMVSAGVAFDIVNDGIMVYTFIPKSQLKNLLVKDEW